MEYVVHADATIRFRHKPSVSLAFLPQLRVRTPELLSIYTCSFLSRLFDVNDAMPAGRQEFLPVHIADNLHSPIYEAKCFSQTILFQESR